MQYDRLIQEITDKITENISYNNTIGRPFNLYHLTTNDEIDINYRGLMHLGTKRQVLAIADTEWEEVDDTPVRFYLFSVTLKLTDLCPTILTDFDEGGATDDPEAYLMYGKYNEYYYLNTVEDYEISNHPNPYNKDNISLAILDPSKCLISAKLVSTFLGVHKF